MRRAFVPLKRAASFAVAFGAFFGCVAPVLAQDGSRGDYARPDRVDRVDRVDRMETTGRDAPAGAFAGKQRRGWLLSLEAVTNAPVDVGARVTAETPFRLRFATGFGVIPEAYLGVVNAAMSGMGAYDAKTAGIIDGTVDGGTVWRTQLGFRPFPRAGFYVDAGYALVNLSGSIYGSDVSAPNVVVDGTAIRDAGYEVHTTLHMWLLELGWQEQVLERMVLGGALGVQGTISADTKAAANFEQGRSAAGRSRSAQATKNIDEVLESYGYVPTLTLRVGYDFL